MQSEGEDVHLKGHYKLYRSRWYILAVLAVLNFSNGIIWMSFGNIAKPTSKYFNASIMQVDFLSIVFMIATLVLGLPAMWLLDRHGLKLSLRAASWTNLVGVAFRVVSTLPQFEGSRYVPLLVGQTISGCAQPFMIFASTKLAAQWFGSKERTVANAIGSLANPLGFCTGGLASSLLVSEELEGQDLHGQMQMLLGLTCSPAILGFLMMMFVPKSRPPTDPSSSAAHEIQSFFWGLKVLSGMKSYLLLSICYGTGVGILSSLVTITDQLLQPHRYSNNFSSICIFLFVTFGFLGAFSTSLVTDRHGNHESVAKVTFCLGAVFLILFVVLSHFPKLHLLVVVVLALGGFFCFSLSPVCLELAVECSYPVAVGTSGGVMVIVGQLMSALLTFILSIDSHLAEEDHGEIISPYSLTAFLLLMAPAPLTFLLFFSSPAFRFRFEQTTREPVPELSESERHFLVENLLRFHSRCSCNEPENGSASGNDRLERADDDGVGDDDYRTGDRISSEIIIN